MRQLPPAHPFDDDKLKEECGVFGVARGVLLVAVALIVYDRVMVDQAVAMVDNSRSAEIFGQMQDRLNEELPEDAPGWIVARYEELMSSCSVSVPPAE